MSSPAVTALESHRLSPSRSSGGSGWESKSPMGRRLANPTPRKPATREQWGKAGVLLESSLEVQPRCQALELSAQLLEPHSECSTLKDGFPHPPKFSYSTVSSRNPGNTHPQAWNRLSRAYSGLESSKPV